MTKPKTFKMKIITKKIENLLKKYGLYLGDLPAFPPKEIDLEKLIIAIGEAKKPNLKMAKQTKDIIDEKLEQRIYYAVSKEIDHREIMKEIKQVFSNLLAEQREEEKQKCLKEFSWKCCLLLKKARKELTEEIKEEKRILELVFKNSESGGYRLGISAGIKSLTNILKEKLK